MKGIVGALALAMGAHASPAFAQAGPGNAVEIEAASDWRSRGLSQSERRAALQASGTWAPAGPLAIEAAITTLRGSQRHGGSTVGLTLAPAVSATAAGWTWRAGLTGRAFDGRGKLSYAEINVGAARTLGPLHLKLGADYAPPQAAIGGDNLHLHAMVATALPGTAFTVHGGGGYSLGRARAGSAAWRLRPQGDYGDIQAGVMHVSGRLALGLRATATVGPRTAAKTPAARRDGASLVGYLRVMAWP